MFSTRPTAAQSINYQLSIIDFPVSLVELQSHNDKELVDDDLLAVRAKTRDPVVRKVVSTLKWSSNDVLLSDTQTDKTRPDFRSDVYQDGNIIYSNIFGEYKAASARGSQSAALDLYRLCLFAKNTIDKKNVRSVLIVQAVEGKVDFYLNTRSFDHVMITVFLCSVSLPATIDCIVLLSAYLDELASVYNIYKKECFESLNAGIKKCPSIPYDVLLNSLQKSNKKNKSL
ncbi:hypothetical protein EDC96DRAFT_549549 [Choanephora cucurbitarum]|nr:hypothetical protein EDC96DRAFT_549549 [Choanephora cucurbitarum]